METLKESLPDKIDELGILVVDEKIVMTATTESWMKLSTEK